MLPRPHAPWGLELGRGLQVLLNALVVLHLRGHGDGDRRPTPAAGEGAGPAAGDRQGGGGVTGDGHQADPRPKLPAHAQHCPIGAEGLLKAHPTPRPGLLVRTSRPQIAGGGTEGREAGQLPPAWEPMPAGPGGPGVLVALVPVVPAASTPGHHGPPTGPPARAGEAWLKTHSSCPAQPAYPEGLGEPLQGGDGDGVRPWLSRPAEATRELLVGTEQTGSWACAAPGPGLGSQKTQPSPNRLTPTGQKNPP